MSIARAENIVPIQRGNRKTFYSHPIKSNVENELINLKLLCGSNFVKNVNELDVKEDLI